MGAVISAKDFSELETADGKKFKKLNAKEALSLAKAFFEKNHEYSSLLADWKKNDERLVSEANTLKQEIAKLKEAAQASEAVPKRTCVWCGVLFSPRTNTAQACDACNDFGRSLAAGGISVINTICERISKLEDRGCGCHCENDYD